MPHQCLQCGHLVGEDATAQLLQGCPSCKGTRFFYTDAAVDDEARKDLADRAQKDLRQVVAQMLQESDPAAAADGDGWAQLRPRDLRRLVRKVQARQNEAPGWENPDVRPLGVVTAGSRARALAEAAAERAGGDARPDTVRAGDGSYEVDVRGLLEKNPIVVHKDGAYMIHLPSLFDQKDR